MAHQDTTPDKPSHTPGTHRGEDWAKHQKEPGRGGKGATARSSTSINADKRGPIDPRMPNLPPA
jgi:ribosomal protein L15